MKKDQVTVLKETRDYLKLEMSDKIDFAIDGNSIVVKVILLTVPVTSLSGILYSPDMPAVTLEDMETSIH